ncbi:MULTISPECIES: Rieske 2Fe-2S domain-containing protein [unclassified Paenibacillus]|uniref:Rieske (2Fe-2S) protein n=1 Tax=unclassified Paenibacillus TaxID=185978 RepID=UPI001AE9FCDA|nr:MULTISPECIES: Rieske 2Fe-2S domain-containing protein [unclassified Paenibacillus]MBP1155766.1 nitrite reductase/ring-hydroxylating ferredoxin subunit [Paenibacillus sp. PvP091]MBP1168848.1 nitrite reductase/ring-hydroxylating ferredoxin subunit [Paenibacillus sp. PvR098]MBP2439876.1 nitrite reductase/ring-hydroxylating ferredoxin subunit [Paenibacillus sp. PvP052]
MVAGGDIVGKVEDFPKGSHKVVKVKNREIGVFNIDGELYALPNLCPHQVGPVCEGRVSGTLAANKDTNWQKQWIKDGEIIACPWHGLEYEIKTGQCLAYQEIKLRTYKVEVQDGLVRLA